MPTEAPAAEAAAPAPSLMDAIQAQNNPAPATAPQAAPQQATPPAPKQEAKSAAPKQEAAKPDAPKQEAAKAPVKADAPKGKGLDALPAMGEEVAKPAEAEKPAIEQEEAPPPGLKPEAQVQWGKFRKAEKELQEIKPRYEQLQKQLEELKTKPIIPEDLTKELDSHRQFRAAFDWQNSDEFKSAVTTPMADQWSNVNMVIDFLQVDATKVEKAMAEPNRMRRNELIKAALSESEKEVDPTTVLEVANAATKMHELHAKGQELQAKALDLQNVLKGRKEQETLAQKQEREATFAKASDETYRAISTKLSEFFQDPATAEEIKGARPADDPMDQAYQAQAGAILPTVVKALNAARAKLAEFEKREKARTAAKPGESGGDSRTQDAPANGEQPTSLMDAVSLQFGQHLRR